MIFATRSIVLQAAMAVMAAFGWGVLVLGVVILGGLGWIVVSPGFIVI